MTTASHGVKAKIFEWRSESVARCHHAIGRRTTVGLLAVQYALADRLVFSKIKARMGGKISSSCQALLR
jgi:long-chain acyl-CoA synthetase